MARGKYPRTIWQGPSWRLIAEKVTLPDGSSLEKAKVEHPGSVVLVPIVGSGADLKLLMIRQYRHVLGATILELPAGTREWGEDWLHCAQRELREETGYRAASFTLLGDIWPSPGLSDELMRIYLASDLSLDPLPADVDEQIEPVPMLLSDLVASARTGSLRDGKSIVGILRAAAYLDR